MKYAILGLLVACAASDAEVRTAKLAQYDGPPQQVYNAALDAAQEKYKIAVSDPQKLDFWTTPRFYSPEGDLQSPGAGDVVNIDNHSVEVSFHVQVVATTPHSSVVSVTPQTFQILKGSPKPRELKPDDPYLPPFVLGRADALQVAIYERSRGMLSH